jgi:hypothetical protein
MFPRLEFKVKLLILGISRVVCFNVSVNISAVIFKVNKVANAKPAETL